MIVGFKEENKGRFHQTVHRADSNGTAIRRWSAEIGDKAIVSSPFTRRSILGRYHIFAIKRLQQKANASKWGKSVQDFTKNGSCQ